MRSNAYCGNLLWQSSLTLPASQKSGFENIQSFKDNYKQGCSLCYMRTAGHGVSVNGAVVIGTAGGNTFTILNVRIGGK